MYFNKLKFNNLIISKNLSFFILFTFFLFSISTISLGQNSDKNKFTYSFFGETGETQDSFTIASRNFPVKVGSVGLKVTYQPTQNINFYSRFGIGYSPKQTVSAFNFNLSGSVLATSIGPGASGEYRIRKSGFVVVPFLDYNFYNYSSDTFRGKKDENQLKASVRGKSSFVRTGIELRYLTTNGHLFFGAGINKWNIENRVTITEGNLIITPRLWANNTDTFFQTGAMFDTGSGKAIIGARMSDLTHEINTQLVEFFAEVRVEFE